MMLHRHFEVARSENMTVSGDMPGEKKKPVSAVPAEEQKPEQKKTRARRKAEQ